MKNRQAAAKTAVGIMLAIIMICTVALCANLDNQSADSPPQKTSSVQTGQEPMPEQPQPGDPSSAQSTPSSNTTVQNATAPNTAGGSEQPTFATPTTEYRAVWFSYMDLQALLKNCSQAQFTQNIATAFDTCANIGLNRVILQVRPFSDALYRSAYFPSSQFAVGTQGAQMSFDPLEIMVQQAKKRGLKVEAWVNPYRISLSNGQYPCATNPATAMMGTDSVVSFNGGLYYNPARQNTQDLIVKGVEELVKNYDIDGIHFDDYFYPSGIDESFDSTAFSEYKAGGGQLSLDGFRTQNVNNLVKRVYQTIKQIKGSVTFTISPQGNVGNCERLYADVRTWCATPGYVDYMVPQLYWGYDHPLQSARYNLKIDEWNAMIKTPSVKLAFGLGSYRIGDTATGYRTNGNDMANMVIDGRQKSAYAGFALFSYGSLIKQNDLVPKEMQALKQVLTK